MSRIKVFALTAAIPAALALSACASDGYYEGSYGYNDYGPSYAGTAFNHSGWYDNYYGPIHHGYWGPRGDVFYYQLRPGDRYHLDDGRHFRRDRFGSSIEFRFRDDDRRRGRGWDRGRGRGRH